MFSGGFESLPLRQSVYDAEKSARRDVASLGTVGSLRVAEQLKEDQSATIVTILCDSGEKYLSQRFWNEE